MANENMLAAKRETHMHDQVVRVTHDDADCALRGHPFACVEFTPSGPRRVCLLLGGSGLGRVRVGGSV